MKSAFLARFCAIAISTVLSMAAVAQTQAVGKEKEACIDLMKKLNSTEQDIVHLKFLESLVEKSNQLAEYAKKVKERLSAKSLQLISSYEAEYNQIRNYYLNTSAEHKDLPRNANGSYTKEYYNKMTLLNKETESKQRDLDKKYLSVVFESFDKDLQTNFVEASMGYLTLQSRKHEYNLPAFFAVPVGYESFEKRDTYNKGKAAFISTHIIAAAYLKDIGKERKIGFDIELDANPFFLVSKEQEGKYGSLRLIYDALNDKESIRFVKFEEVGKIDVEGKKEVLTSLKQLRRNLQSEAFESDKIQQNLAEILSCVNTLDVYSLLPDPTLAWGSKENKSVKSYNDLYERNENQ